MDVLVCSLDQKSVCDIFYRLAQSMLGIAYTNRCMDNDIKFKILLYNNYWENITAHNSIILMKIK